MRKPAARLGLYLLGSPRVERAGAPVEADTREAALHNNLADLLHTAGRSEAAMAHLRQAVALFAEIGTQAGDMQPEIWKLTEW